MVYHHLKKFFKKVSDAYKDRREQIINQKDLIIKNLDLKKNLVLKQDLEPILDISLSHLDPLKGVIKVHLNFQLLIYLKLFLYFYNKSKIKSI